MMVSQNEKASRFRTLHNGPGAFVIHQSMGCRVGPHSRGHGVPGVGDIKRRLRHQPRAKRWRANAG